MKKIIDKFLNLPDDTREDVAIISMFTASISTYLLINLVF